MATFGILSQSFVWSNLSDKRVADRANKIKKRLKAPMHDLPEPDKSVRLKMLRLDSYHTYQKGNKRFSVSSLIGNIKPGRVLRNQLQR
jgi:hypothetical protein